MVDTGISVLIRKISSPSSFPNSFNSSSSITLGSLNLVEIHPLSSVSLCPQQLTDPSSRIAQVCSHFPKIKFGSMFKDIRFEG